MQPRLSETYTFHTLSDDGVRLWVNRVQVINNWTDHSPTENVGSSDLVAGQLYDIRMEFYENGGGAVAALSWSAPDLPVEIIPQTQLYSGRPPMILVQPKDTKTPLGSNATFTVTADGAPPLVYRWFFAGAALPGATATNLVVTNVQSANFGNYWVVITNSAGAVTSTVASLKLSQPAVFTLQPQGQTVVVGDTVTFSVAVSGAPPFGFRWRLGTATYVPFGLGTSNLTITNVQLTNAGYYTVVVTNIDSPFGVLSAPAALTVLVDTDGDHMPDEWEMAHGLNRLVNDAALDPDGDGMTNLQEYIAGTDPQDSLSYLKVDQITAGQGGTVLRFTAMPNKSYTVLYREAINSGAWLTLTNVSQVPIIRGATVYDRAGAGSTRFYRLATPALP